MKIFGFKAGCLAACMAAMTLLYPVVSMAQASPLPGGSAAPTDESAPAAAPAPDPNAGAKRQAQRQALGFLRDLDMGQYTESYAYTSTLIRSKANEEQFSKEVRKDRAGAGSKQSRKLMDATYTTTLANEPKGQYVVLQYSTDFANKKGALETLTMSYESSYWRVAGWYIK